MFFWRDFARLWGRKMVLHQIHLRAAIDRFLRLLSLNKPFSVSLTPLLLRQIKYKSICKRLHKPGNIAGVPDPRNVLLMNRWRNSSPAVSSDGQRAKIPHNYRGPSFTSVSFSPGWRGREKQRQLTPLNNSVLAKNPWRSWIFSAKLKLARFFISHEEPPGWPRRFWRWIRR